MERGQKNFTIPINVPVVVLGENTSEFEKNESLSLTFPDKGFSYIEKNLKRKSIPFHVQGTKIYLSDDYDFATAEKIVKEISDFLESQRLEEICGVCIKDVDFKDKTRLNKFLALLFHESILEKPGSNFLFCKYGDGFICFGKEALTNYTCEKFIVLTNNSEAINRIISIFNAKGISYKEENLIKNKDLCIMATPDNLQKVSALDEISPRHIIDRHSLSLIEKINLLAIDQSYREEEQGQVDNLLNQIKTLLNE